MPEAYLRQKQNRSKAFGTYAERQPLNADALRSKTPDPKRFEAAAKLPSDARSITIGVGAGHDVTEALLGRSFYKDYKDNESYVDCDPFAGKRRLDIKCLKLKHMAPKKLGDGANIYTGFYKKAMSTAGEASHADPWLAHQARLKHLGHNKRTDVGLRFRQQSNRDPTARYLAVVGQISENIDLENTRDTRQREIAAHREIRRNAVRTQSRARERRPNLDEIGPVFDYVAVDSRFRDRSNTADG